MAKKTTAGELPVYNTIVIKQPNRASSDVNLWRSALRAADMGRVKMLYDLFDDLLIDPVLYSNWMKRVNAIGNSELVFQTKKGEENEDVKDIIESIGWDNLIHSIMQYQSHGRFAAECSFIDGFDCRIIPPKHVSLATHSILINDSDERGIDYRNEKNLIVFGDPRDFGIFLRTAPYAIWKRGGFGDYAEWLEIFGMPQRIGKYSSYDPASRIALEKALENAGSAPWCVIPKETEVETVNNTGSGSSGSSFNEFRQACNEEILISVVGNTLTTVSGEKGARSLGEVHREVEEGIFKSDMRFVQKILNSYFVPLLEARGFNVKGGRFIFPDDVEALSVGDIISLSTIIQIPESFVREKYGLPKPEGDEAIAGKKPEPEEKTEEKDNRKLVDDRNFLLKLFDKVFPYAPTNRSGALKKFWTNWTGSTKKLTLADDGYTIDINALFRQAVREIYGNRGEELLNRNLFEITNIPFQQAIDTTLESVDDKTFADRFRNSCAEFAAFKNHIQTKALAEALYNEDGHLRSFRNFRKQAELLGEKFNVNYLKTEYDTLVRSLTVAGSLKGYERTLHLYPNLEYVHTRSAHPDAGHLRYVGTVLPFHHSAWMWLIPPSRWNCMCSVRPTKAPATEAPKIPEGFDPVFDNNAYISGEFVNIKETPYYKHTPEELREQVKEKAKEFLRENASEQRKKHLEEMKRLYIERIEKDVDDRKIVIGFNRVGNKHLYHDINGRAKGFNVNDLKRLDELLKEATFIKHTGLSKDRSDSIVGFFYFHDTRKNVYYNVAERVFKKPDGSESVEMFLYAITKTIK